MAALFKRTTKDAVPAAKAPSVPAVAPDVQTPNATKGTAAVASRAGAPGVLIEPYLTEKTSVLAEQGQYTFLVQPNAEKIAIARAIALRYRVHPTRVRIVRTLGKRVRYGRTVGQRSGTKKAVVTLRKGETMPFGVRT